MEFLLNEEAKNKYVKNTYDKDKIIDLGEQYAKAGVKTARRI